MTKVEVTVRCDKDDDSSVRCDVCLLNDSQATTLEKEIAFNIKKGIVFWLKSIVESGKEKESENGKD